MRERLSALTAEYDDLQVRMRDPAVFGDPREVARIGRRIAELEPLMELAAEYRKCLTVLEDEARLKDDPDLGGIAVEEAKVARERIAVLEAQMQEHLVPRDPLDARNAVVEVRAGTGGEEASIFAGELLRMYLRYAEGKGWAVQLMDRAETDGGGIKEAVIRIAGAGAYGDLRYEAGVHRVQRIPATESKGRIHTSAATVAVLPEAEEVDLHIRNEDLRIDTYRAGGAGGQHVNKTESAVRITHLPTGVVVSCQSERSQVQNRARAMELLRTRLYAELRERREKEEGTLRSAQVGSGDRSEKIRTYNFPQDRLTDHRIGANFHNLPAILDGEIGDIVAALQKSVLESRMAAVHGV